MLDMESVVEAMVEVPVVTWIVVGDGERRELGLFSIGFIESKCLMGALSNAVSVRGRAKLNYYSG